MKIKELMGKDLNGPRGDQTELALAALQVALRALRVFQCGFPPGGVTIQNYATARVAEVAEILELVGAGRRTDENLRRVFG